VCLIALAHAVCLDQNMQELKISKWCIGFLVLMDTAFCTNSKKYLIWFTRLVSAVMVLYYRCSFVGGIYHLLTEILKSTDVTFPRVSLICHLLANILNKNCKLSWESYVCTLSCILNNFWEHVILHLCSMWLWVNIFRAERMWIQGPFGEMLLYLPQLLSWRVDQRSLCFKGADQYHCFHIL
jgi:hypothetical protein